MTSYVCSVCSNRSQALPFFSVCLNGEKGWWLQAAGGEAEKAKTGTAAAISCCTVSGSQASTSTHPTPNKSLGSLGLPA